MRFWPISSGLPLGRPSALARQSDATLRWPPRPPSPPSSPTAADEETNRNRIEIDPRRQDDAHDGLERGTLPAFSTV